MLGNDIRHMHGWSSIIFLSCQIFFMSAMVVLLCASILVALIFLFAFIWSVKDGQYDDEYSPAHKILFEEKENQNE